MGNIERINKDLKELGLFDVDFEGPNQVISNPKNGNRVVLGHRVAALGKVAERLEKVDLKSISKFLFDNTNS